MLGGEGGERVGFEGGGGALGWIRRWLSGDGTARRSLTRRSGRGAKAEVDAAAAQFLEMLLRLEDESTRAKELQKLLRGTSKYAFERRRAAVVWALASKGLAAPIGSPNRLSALSIAAALGSRNHERLATARWQFLFAVEVKGGEDGAGKDGGGGMEVLVPTSTSTMFPSSSSLSPKSSTSSSSLGDLVSTDKHEPLLALMSDDAGMVDRSARLEVLLATVRNGRRVDPMGHRVCELLLSLAPPIDWCASGDPTKWQAALEYDGAIGNLVQSAALSLSQTHLSAFLARAEAEAQLGASVAIRNGQVDAPTAVAAPLSIIGATITAIGTSIHDARDTPPTTFTTSSYFRRGEEEECKGCAVDEEDREEEVDDREEGVVESETSLLNVSSSSDLLARGLCCAAACALLPACASALTAAGRSGGVGFVRRLGRIAVERGKSCAARGAVGLLEAVSAAHPPFVLPALRAIEASAKVSLDARDIPRAEALATVIAKILTSNEADIRPAWPRILNAQIMLANLLQQEECGDRDGREVGVRESVHLEWVGRLRKALEEVVLVVLGLRESGALVGWESALDTALEAVANARVIRAPVRSFLCRRAFQSLEPWDGAGKLSKHMCRIARDFFEFERDFLVRESFFHESHRALLRLGRAALVLWLDKSKPGLRTTLVAGLCDPSAAVRVHAARLAAACLAAPAPSALRADAAGLLLFESCVGRKESVAEDSTDDERGVEDGEEDDEENAARVFGMSFELGNPDNALKAAVAAGISSRRDLGAVVLGSVLCQWIRTFDKDAAMEALFSLVSTEHSPSSPSVASPPRSASAVEEHMIALVLEEVVAVGPSGCARSCKEWDGGRWRLVWSKQHRQLFSVPLGLEEEAGAFMGAVVGWWSRQLRAGGPWVARASTALRRCFELVAAERIVVEHWREVLSIAESLIRTTATFGEATIRDVAATTAMRRAAVQLMRRGSVVSATLLASALDPWEQISSSVLSMPSVRPSKSQSRPLPPPSSSIPPHPAATRPNRLHIAAPPHSHDARAAATAATTAGCAAVELLWNLATRHFRWTEDATPASAASAVVGCAWHTMQRCGASWLALGPGIEPTLPGSGSLLSRFPGNVVSFLIIASPLVDVLSHIADLCDANSIPFSQPCPPASLRQDATDDPSERSSASKSVEMEHLSQSSSTEKVPPPSHPTTTTTTATVPTPVPTPTPPPPHFTLPPSTASSTTTSSGVASTVPIIPKPPCLSMRRAAIAACLAVLTPLVEPARASEWDDKIAAVLGPTAPAPDVRPSRIPASRMRPATAHDRDCLTLPELDEHVALLLPLMTIRALRTLLAWYPTDTESSSLTHAVLKALDAVRVPLLLHTTPTEQPQLLCLAQISATMHLLLAKLHPTYAPYDLYSKPAPDPLLATIIRSDATRINAEGIVAVGAKGVLSTVCADGVHGGISSAWDKKEVGKKVSEFLLATATSSSSSSPSPSPSTFSASGKQEGGSSHPVSSTSPSQLIPNLFILPPPRRAALSTDEPKRVPTPPHLRQIAPVPLRRRRTLSSPPVPARLRLPHSSSPPPAIKSPLLAAVVESPRLDASPAHTITKPPPPIPPPTSPFPTTASVVSSKSSTTSETSSPPSTPPPPPPSSPTLPKPSSPQSQPSRARSSSYHSPMAPPPSSSHLAATNSHASKEDLAARAHRDIDLLGFTDADIDIVTRGKSLEGSVGQSWGHRGKRRSSKVGEVDGMSGEGDLVSMHSTASSSNPIPARLPPSLVRTSSRLHSSSNSTSFPHSHSKTTSFPSPRLQSRPTVLRWLEHPLSTTTGHSQQSQSPPPRAPSPRFQMQARTAEDILSPRREHGITSHRATSSSARSHLTSPLRRGSLGWEDFPPELHLDRLSHQHPVPTSSTPTTSTAITRWGSLLLKRGYAASEAEEEVIDGDVRILRKSKKGRKEGGVGDGDGGGEGVVYQLVRAGPPWLRRSLQVLTYIPRVETHKIAVRGVSGKIADGGVLGESFLGELGDVVGPGEVVFRGGVSATERGALVRVWVSAWEQVAIHVEGCVEQRHWGNDHVVILVDDGSKGGRHVWDGHGAIAGPFARGAVILFPIHDAERLLIQAAIHPTLVSSGILPLGLAGTSTTPATTSTRHAPLPVLTALASAPSDVSPLNLPKKAAAIVARRIGILTDMSLRVAQEVHGNGSLEPVSNPAERWEKVRSILWRIKRG